MSSAPVVPVTLQTLLDKKAGGKKIVMTTAYASWQARLADEAGIDALIVGDSAAHVELGYTSTVPCKVSDLLPRLTACWRGTKRCLLIGDMPFGSYEVSNEQAISTAVEFIQHGASVVKMEGPCFDRIEAIARRGILVMAHLGLTPQQRARYGGYKVQGRTSDTALTILNACETAASAGADLLLLEAVPSTLGRAVAARLRVPVIGVGAGPDVDGQTVILHDLLGLFDQFKPKFAKRYADGAQQIRSALSEYAKEVRETSFPAAEHCYYMAEGELEKLVKKLSE